MASVYISSTFEDLQDFRKEVAAAMKRLDFKDLAMEYYVAEDTRPLERCLNDVSACDIYVGIFAFRYGFVPEENNASRCSITELEYSKACETGKPCLIFLMSEDAPWPQSKADKGVARERLDALRERLRKRHSVNFFISADELTRKINEALVQWQKGGALGGTRPQTDWDSYRRAVVDRHQWVRMQVIAGVSKDRGPIRIPLIEIFEPQLVAVGASGTDVPDHVRKYQEAIYGAKPEASDDESPSSPTTENRDDADVASDEDVLLASNPEFIVDIVGRESAQVMLGGPGTGKSTILHYVMLRVCQTGGDSDRTPIHLGAQPIPFLIELRNYALQKQSDFLNYIVHNLRTTYDTVVGVDTLSALFEQPQRSLVFFDGLDEVFDPDERRRVIAEFQTFARRYPQARILVTSRIAGYDPSSLGTAGFQHYTLLPLALSQIRRFADNWYRHYTLAGTERTAQGLVQRIVESPRMLDLAGNPLLLTMMAVVYKDRDLPHERWRLYQRCAETLLEDWELGKGIEIEDFKLAVLIRTAQKSEILQRVSMFMLEHAQPGKQLNAIAYASLLQRVAGYLEEKYKRSPGDAEAIAVDILKHLMEHTYVLAGIGERVFGFVHRTFMEYFAACHCQAQFNASKSDFKWITKRVFGAHWRDSEWEEVLLLLIAMLHDQGTPIREIVESVRQGKSAVPFRLAFAARCLGEAGDIQDVAHAQELLGELAGAIADHVLSSKKTFTNAGLKGFATLAPAVGSTAAVKSAIERLTQSKRLPARVVAWQMEFALRSHKERFAYALGALRDNAEIVRRGAIAALEREWPGRAEIGRHLVDVVQLDRQAPVRHAALAALQRSWRGEPAILDVLASRSDQERGHRNLVRYIRFLGSTWPGHATARELVIKMASQPGLGNTTVDAEILAAAGDVLANGWKGDIESFEFITNQAKHTKDAQLKANLVKSLADGWKGQADALAFLQDIAINDHDANARAAALTAIANGWGGNTSLLPFMQSTALAEPDDHARDDAFSALVQGWSDHPQTVAFLREVAKTATVVESRIAALQALVHGWRLDPDTMQFVRDCAVADPSVQCRAAVFRMLARNPFSNSLFFVYERSIVDPDPDARSAAERALHQTVEYAFWNPNTLYEIRSRLGSPTVAVRQSAIAVLRMVISGWHFGLYPDRFLTDSVGGFLRQMALDDPDPEIREGATELAELINRPSSGPPAPEAV